MKYQDYINKSLEEDQAEVAARKTVNIPKDYAKHDDFDLAKTGRNYDNQFFSMYQARLSNLKQRVDEVAIKKWGEGEKKIDGKKILRVEKILNITSNQLCWVSGTIFCNLDNKLNILKDVEKGVDDILPQVPNSYISQENEGIIMLEDESGRAILQGDEFFKKNLVVTGMIVAILGIELQAGVFDIVDIVYPSVSPQLPFKPTQPSSKIAFISGLEISDSANYDIRLELLRQYLQGEIGSKEQIEAAANISHVVIAGNSIKGTELESNDEYHSLNNYGSKNISRFTSESLKLFDRFISELVATTNISIMPGESDPTDICLPQQKLHKSFFLSSKNYVGTNINLLTNPAWLEIDSLRMLGTSGQNVSDISKYLTTEKLEDPDITMKIMESTLLWQNIAPTAPDTLYCFPFDNCDPFTLTNETPRIYFSGNQQEFNSKKVKIGESETTLISIPKFSETGQIVLLDKQTHQVELINII